MTGTSLKFELSALVVLGTDFLLKNVQIDSVTLFTLSCPFSLCNV